MVRQKPILWKGRSTSASELLERLGDVPLIAATTVAGRHSVSSPQEGWDGRSPSLGEKGHLPLNTLNKMNRKRGEESAERGREGARVKRRGDRFFRRPVRHPRRPLAVGRHSQNVLTVREMGIQNAWHSQKRATNGTAGRETEIERPVSEKDRMTDTELWRQADLLPFKAPFLLPGAKGDREGGRGLERRGRGEKCRRPFFGKFGQR